MESKFLPPMDDENDDGRPSIGMRNGIFISIVIWFLISLFFMSCAPKRIILKPVGMPIKSEHDMVKALFPYVGSNDFAAQWFYFPGIGIIPIEEYRIVITLEKIR